MFRMRVSHTHAHMHNECIKNKLQLYEKTIIKTELHDLGVE
jgi:hypothetical protein